MTERDNLRASLEHDWKVLERVIDEPFNSYVSEELIRCDLSVIPGYKK
ncbi:hypothetical protein KA107_03740 [Candidatus Pacearchaeota archaeon]|nr:hypothetical protein [Candidatus Pacearchaeota archaeon]